MHPGDDKADMFMQVASSSHPPATHGMSWGSVFELRSYVQNEERESMRRAWRKKLSVKPGMRDWGGEHWYPATKTRLTSYVNLSPISGRPMFKGMCIGCSVRLPTR